MALTHDELVRTLEALYPDSEWSYDGDGTSLDATHQTVDAIAWVADDSAEGGHFETSTAEILASNGLDWHDKKNPAPKLKDLEKAHADVQLQTLRDAKKNEIRDALAATDWWLLREAEGGQKMTAKQKAYRAALRDLHTKADTAKAPTELALPALPGGAG